ncbi:augmin subunit 5 [Tanacetum coccineum]
MFFCQGAGAGTSSGSFLSLNIARGIFAFNGPEHPCMIVYRKDHWKLRNWFPWGIALALLEYVGPNSSTGPEAVVVKEKNVTVLTARAASGDPSVISSIGRVSSALQYPVGLEVTLASVLKSMEFCLKLRGFETYVLEELSKALN